MSARRRAPAAPKGLQAAGKALWKAVLGDLAPGWQLDARETHLLVRAARCADELAVLEKAIDRDGVTVTGSRGQVVTHPALAEARQLRLTQLRLLSAIELTDPAQAVRAATPAQARGRRAAQVRWQLEGQRRGRARG